MVDGIDPHLGAINLVFQVAWKSRDLKVRSNFILHCGYHQIQLIISLETFQQIWAKLKSTYKHKHNASQVGIHKHIFCLSLSKSQSLIEFLEEWQGALDEAIVARFIILESLQVTSLLASLPPSWWPFVTTQSSTPNQTLAELLGKIFQESTMKQTSNNNFSKSIAFFARNKGKINGDKNQNFHNVSSSII
jgi:hypothetical protein